MMTRQKILPEDMVQKTNLRQHNLMIDAINEVDERQEIVEHNSAAATLAVAALSRKHEADIADLEEELAAFPSEVQSMIIDAFSTHLKNVLVDAGMLRFSADNKAIFLQKNRRDGTVVDEQIPLSTRQNVGLATPEDLLAIDELTDRVTTLENSGITGELFYLHHDFSGITDAVRTVHFTADLGKPPTVGDSVIDSQQQSWRYVITGPATFGWVTVPHLSIGGDLQAVKSSNADGKVYVESDNTCSVVGWNSVKNDVSSNANAITDHAGNTTNPHGVTKAQIGLDAYPASPADIGISTATQTELALKADKTELAQKADKTELALLIAQLFSPVDCTAVAGLYNGDTSVRVSSPINAVNCTNLNNMFYGCSNLKIVGYIHTPNVTHMSNMFYGCSSLKTIPLLDTSKVTDMGTMFNNCSSLTTIPSLDTSKVTNMRSMFNNCSSLTTIPSLDISSVTDMGYMFQACSSLTTIPTLDTSKVTDMGTMFNNCSSLTTIPTLDTSKVTNMRSMFNNCSSLTTIPTLDISSVTDMGYMFQACSSLTSVTFQCNDVRPYGSSMFGNTPIASGTGRIYVPDNLVQAYKTASGWSSRASVIYGLSAKP